MRPPWIEAQALLAAGPLATMPRPPFDDTILMRRRPFMAKAITHALLPGLEPGVKPIAFADLDGLARHIQRARGRDGLAMEEIADLELPARSEPTRAVKVWATDAGGHDDRFLGYAWLDGGGMETLKSALRRNRLVIAAPELRA